MKLMSPLSQNICWRFKDSNYKFCVILVLYSIAFVLNQLYEIIIYNNKKNFKGALIYIIYSALRKYSYPLIFLSRFMLLSYVKVP